MNKYVERLYNGVVKENPSLVLMLGMCPTLAVTTSAVNGIGTVVDGIAQAFQIACRGQQFRDLQHSSNSSHFSVFTVLFTCAAFWQFALCSLRVRA